MGEYNHEREQMVIVAVILGPVIAMILTVVYAVLATIFALPLS